MAKPTGTRSKVKAISKASVVRINPEIHERLKECSKKTWIPINKILEEAAEDWLQCVAPARIEAIQKAMNLRRG